MYQCLAKDDYICFPRMDISGKKNIAPRGLILPVDMLTEKGYFLVIFLISHDSRIFFLMPYLQALCTGETPMMI